MTSSYLIEMHDVICVNFYRTKSLLNPQRTGVTGPSATTLFYITILIQKEFTTPFEEISPQELNKCL